MPLILNTEHFDHFLKMEADQLIREFHQMLPQTISKDNEEFEILDHIVLHWLRYHPGVSKEDVIEMIKLINHCNEKYHLSIFRGETYRMIRVMLEQFGIKNVHSRIFSLNADRIREGKSII